MNYARWNSYTRIGDFSWSFIRFWRWLELPMRACQRLLLLGIVTEIDAGVECWELRQMRSAGKLCQCYIDMNMEKIWPELGLHKIKLKYPSHPKSDNVVLHYSTWCDCSAPPLCRVRMLKMLTSKLDQNKISLDQKLDQVFNGLKAIESDEVKLFTEMWFSGLTVCSTSSWSPFTRSNFIDKPKKKLLVLLFYRF